MIWGRPWGFLALLLVPTPWLWGLFRGRIGWSSVGLFPKNRVTIGTLFAWSPNVLRALGIAALAVALARPQTVGGRTYIKARGVTIVVALDRSSSMKSVDVAASEGPISRLEAARRAFVRFVAGRPDDLIGLVSFANYPDTTCPPTLDHKVLLESVAAIKTARAGDDGTTLGDAIAWATHVARDTSPQKKVVVLITDGHDSPGVSKPLEPIVAATLANRLGVVVHTIAIGPVSGVERRRQADTAGLDLVRETDGPDLDLLEKIAISGGGRAFVATDSAALEAIFQTLDSLEKSPFSGKIEIHYQEHYQSWILIAIAALALERFLAAGRFRRLP